jgi:hypothetical protein
MLRATKISPVVELVIAMGSMRESAHVMNRVCGGLLLACSLREHLSLLRKHIGLKALHTVYEPL